MALLEELKKRAKEDVPGLLGLKFNNPVLPYPVEWAIDADRNTMTFVIIAEDVGEEIHAAPNCISEFCRSIRSGNEIRLGGEEFDSTEFVFNRQLRVYASKISFEKDIARQIFGDLGIRLLIREYGNSPALEKRSALIIGNNDYQQMPTLDNAIRDCAELARTVRSVGFNVRELLNASSAELEEANNFLAIDSANSDVFFLYFAGHGFDLNGVSYLAQIDAIPENVGSIGHSCVNLNQLLRSIQEKTNCSTLICVVDACRNNPFEGTNANYIPASHKVLPPPPGSIVFTSTSVGDTASDGTGENSLFASILMNRIGTPGITCEEVFSRTLRETVRQTNGAQIPWVTSSLTSDFYFKK